MSIGPLSGIAASMAGAPLAQTRGAEVDRTQQENSARELRAKSDLKAEMAAGVGQADGDDHQAAERDADGRQLWAFPQRPEQDEPGEPPREPRGRDATGQAGNMLDLSG